MIKKRRNFSYILPIILLLATIVLSVSLSFIPDDYLTSDQRVTIALSVLGIGFATFQFWISEINMKKRKLYDLRYSAIKELNIQYVILFNIICKYFYKENEKVNEFSTEILDAATSFDANLLTNIELLFPDFINNETYKECEEKLDEIGRITIEYASNRPKLKSNLKRKWNNEIIESLESLNIAITKLSRLLKDSLIYK